MATKPPLSDNLIIDKTFQFAVGILKFSESLITDKHYILAKQLQRSGTSIGANTREAQNAESKLDFIHKFKIAAREADETEYWLLLYNEVLDDPKTIELLAEIKVIQKILTKIIASTKNSLKSTG